MLKLNFLICCYLDSEREKSEVNLIDGCVFKDKVFKFQSDVALDMLYHVKTLNLDELERE